MAIDVKITQRPTTSHTIDLQIDVSIGALYAASRGKDLAIELLDEIAKHLAKALFKKS